MTFLTLLQIILGLLVITFILLQPAGSGMEGALGGGNGSETSIQSTRRGFELFSFRATIVVSVTFVAVSFIQLFV